MVKIWEKQNFHSKVILSAEEFSALNLLLEEYRSGSLGVTGFAAELAEMISHGEKVKDAPEQGKWLRTCVIFLSLPSLFSGVFRAGK